MTQHYPSIHSPYPGPSCRASFAVSGHTSTGFEDLGVDVLGGGIMLPPRTGPVRQVTARAQSPVEGRALAQAREDENTRALCAQPSGNVGAWGWAKHPPSHPFLPLLRAQCLSQKRAQSMENYSRTRLQSCHDIWPPAAHAENPLRGRSRPRKALVERAWGFARMCSSPVTLCFDSWSST